MAVFQSMYRVGHCYCFTVTQMIVLNKVDDTLVRKRPYYARLDIILPYEREDITCVALLMIQFTVMNIHHDKCIVCTASQDILLCMH